MEFRKLKSEADFQLGHCLHALMIRDNWTFIFFLTEFDRPFSRLTTRGEKSFAHPLSVYFWYSHMTYKSDRREGTAKEREKMGIWHSGLLSLNDLNQRIQFSLNTTSVFFFFFFIIFIVLELAVIVDIAIVNIRYWEIKWMNSYFFKWIKKDIALLADIRGQHYG